MQLPRDCKRSLTTQTSAGSYAGWQNIKFLSCGIIDAEHSHEAWTLEQPLGVWGIELCHLPWMCPWSLEVHTIMVSVWSGASCSTKAHDISMAKDMWWGLPGGRAWGPYSISILHGPLKYKRGSSGFHSYTESIMKNSRRWVLELPGGCWVNLWRFNLEKRCTPRKTALWVGRVTMWVRQS
jgi:hypothetical protein